MLQKVPKTRICSLARLQEQSIFSDIDWKALEEEAAQPPFVPQLSSDDDVRYIPSKYATTLCTADGATLDDFHEAVTTLEETARAARRVLGGANPTTVEIERALRKSRAGLRARETPSRSA